MAVKNPATFGLVHGCLDGFIYIYVSLYRAVFFELVLNLELYYRLLIIGYYEIKK